MIPYANRHDAGRTLGHAVAELLGPGGAAGIVVLALPRGGVPVGRDVARAIGAPLRALPVRKIGLPSWPELAVGAIASGGVVVLDRDRLHTEHVTPHDLDDVIHSEERELARQSALFGEAWPETAPPSGGVILVDDGLATGLTMRAAIETCRAHHPARLIVAAPVGAPDTCAALTADGLEVVCPLQPHPFHAVGQWYRHFEPTEDAEVIDCLSGAA